MTRIKVELKEGLTISENRSKRLKQPEKRSACGQRHFERHMAAKES